MTTREITAALTRRRFLLLAAAASAGTLATACADPLRDLDAPTGTTPSDPSPSAATTAPTAVSTPVSSGGPAAPQPLRGNGSRRTPGAAADARTALSDFGTDFLRRARALDPKSPNLAISPYSLFTVLAMARAGAKGATAAQIDSALHSAGVDAQGAVISAVDAGVAAAISAAVNMARPGDEPIVLRTANQTWVQTGFPVHQDYLDALAVQFGVQAVDADFAADPEAMRVALNRWVAQRTDDLIPELFPTDSIDPATRVVLVNALYLKAPWQEPFTPTDPIDFSTTAGPTVSAPMMRSPSPLDGALGDGWASVTLSYAGGQAAMTLLVPDAGRFDETIAGLDPATIEAAGRSGRSVQVTIPRFELATTAPAKDIAKELGIIDIFESADLSGIAGAPGDLFATELVHQAVVTIDENGTEAAAATAMIVAESSAPAPEAELVVDRPFLFWISETTTGAPLFLGVVTDPTA